MTAPPAPPLAELDHTVNVLESMYLADPDYVSQLPIIYSGLNFSQNSV